ncbi:MAG: RrF2 family transcriptional regulator [Planctomycetota bacterium]
MRLIEKTSVYAIKALLYMYSQLEKKDSRENKYFLAPRIAQKCEIPKFYLSKILEHLVKKGILISAKGKKGGYTFAVLPKQITLYDIVEPFENLYTQKICFFEGGICKLYDTTGTNKGCVLHPLIKETSLHFFNQLKNITLESIFLANPQLFSTQRTITRKR